MQEVVSCPSCGYKQQYSGYSRGKMVRCRACNYNWINVTSVDLKASSIKVIMDSINHYNYTMTIYGQKGGNFPFYAIDNQYIDVSFLNKKADILPTTKLTDTYSGLNRLSIDDRHPMLSYAHGSHYKYTGGASQYSRQESSYVTTRKYPNLDRHYDGMHRDLSSSEATTVTYKHSQHQIVHKDMQEKREYNIQIPSSFSTQGLQEDKSTNNRPISVNSRLVANYQAVPRTMVDRIPLQANSDFNRSVDTGVFLSSDSIQKEEKYGQPDESIARNHSSVVQQTQGELNRDSTLEQSRVLLEVPRQKFSNENIAIAQQESRLTTEEKTLPRKLSLKEEMERLEKDNNIDEFLKNSTERVLAQPRKDSSSFQEHVKMEMKEITQGIGNTEGNPNRISIHDKEQAKTTTLKLPSFKSSTPLVEKAKESLGKPVGLLPKEESISYEEYITLREQRKQLVATKHQEKIKQKDDLLQLKERKSSDLSAKKDTVTKKHKDKVDMQKKVSVSNKLRQSLMEAHDSSTFTKSYNKDKYLSFVQNYKHSNVTSTYDSNKNNNAYREYYAEYNQDKNVPTHSVSQSNNEKWQDVHIKKHNRENKHKKVEHTANGTEKKSFLDDVISSMDKNIINLNINQQDKIGGMKGLFKKDNIFLRDFVLADGNAKEKDPLGLDQSTEEFFTNNENSKNTKKYSYKDIVTELKKRINKDRMIFHVTTYIVIIGMLLFFANFSEMSYKMHNDARELNISNDFVNEIPTIDENPKLDKYAYGRSDTLIIKNTDIDTTKSPTEKIDTMSGKANVFPEILSIEKDKLMSKSLLLESLQEVDNTTMAKDTSNNKLSYFANLMSSVKESFTGLFDDVKITVVSTSWKEGSNGRYFETFINIKNKSAEKSYRIDKIEISFLDISGNIINKRLLQPYKTIKNQQSINTKIIVPKVPALTASAYIFLREKKQVE